EPDSTPTAARRGRRNVMTVKKVQPTSSRHSRRYSDRMTSAVPPPGVSIADARLEEVSDGIYAYIQPDGSWWINNTGFLVGRHGVVSIDACSTERRTRAYLAALGS